MFLFCSFLKDAVLLLCYMGYSLIGMLWNIHCNCCVLNDTVQFLLLMVQCNRVQCYVCLTECTEL